MYWGEIDIDWFECRTQINQILSKESELKNIIQLIGEENLPEIQQLTLFTAKLIREGMLIQNAFDEIDTYTDPKKLMGLVKLLLLFYKESKDLLNQGIFIDEIKELKVVNNILRIRHSIPNNEFDKIVKIKKNLLAEIELLKMMSGVLKRK
ncbi:MAG: ATP synthase beta subunit C-terminal domain-containing protein [Promethearchaeota archaeon]